MNTLFTHETKKCQSFPDFYNNKIVFYILSKKHNKKDKKQKFKQKFKLFREKTNKMYKKYTF